MKIKQVLKYKGDTQFSKYTIRHNENVRQALKKLNEIPDILTLFVLNEKHQVIGTLTDGDIRRGIINGLNVDENVEKFYYKNFRYLKSGKNNFDKIKELRELRIKAVPVLDENGKLKAVYNFSQIRSLLPVDAVIMAGGEGRRLRPLTEETPKPLLKVGSKPIIDYNIERVQYFGIQNLFITVRYKAEKIEQHIKNKNYNLNISLLYETEKPLGTIGAIGILKNQFINDTILVMNSDLLTNINYEDFYRSFLDKNADMMIASIPYDINLPYAIFETENRTIKSLKEKPQYTYYANAGLYLIKKSLLELIPENKEFNATDFIETLIGNAHKVMHYPIRNYWLDIGKLEDYEKAQKDISHIDWE